MAQFAALLLVVLGLLPVANWIPGGHAAPWYNERLRLWLSGGAIVVGVALLVGIAVRRYPRLWPTGVWHRVASRWRGANHRVDVVIAVIAATLYAIVSRTILSARPLLIDEVIQLYQARLFATGRLWEVAPAHPEFTSSMHLLDWGGKVYGQFPAGGPAMLAIGTLLHAEWLVGPVVGAVGVYLFARLLRMIEPRDGTSLAALLLAAFAPFVVFLSGSMMNHVSTTMWLVAASLALTAATRCADAAPRAAFLAGLCLGVAASIRPLDAASFALPAAGWLMWRALRGGAPHLRALLWSGVGIAIPIAALLAVNAAQSGHPFEFGYITMWGKSHELGFHEAPWGFPHTPARGIELVNLYLLRLQSYFLETPVPALLFATGALALTRTLTAFDRYVLMGSGLLLLSYFAYWHDGFYLGPRFLLPLAPWLALWTARFPATLAERAAPLPLQRAVVAGGMTALAMGAALLLPIRATQYRNGMLSMRFDVDALARQAGVQGALVFVRESWGAQLMVRMWALGVSRVESQRIYDRMDSCRLDELLADTEQMGGTGRDFLNLLPTLGSDVTPPVRMRMVADTTIRLTPGIPLARRCLDRLRENQAGFTFYSPLLPARGVGNIYVRDLHARDSLMLRRFPSRKAFLLVKDTIPGSRLRFVPVQLDSAIAEWHGPVGGHNE